MSARRAPDPRPAKTREAILAAVGRLPALPAEQVTVTAITRLAGVSRSVFYLHFTSLEDLLAAALAQTVESGLREVSVTTHPASPRAAMVAFLTQLVAHIESRATFYTASLGWRTSVRVQDETIAGYARRLRELTATIRDSASDGSTLPSRKHTDFAATFVAGGISAALTDWLRTGRTTPSATLVDEMIELLPAWLVTEDTDSTEEEHPPCHA